VPDAESLIKLLAILGGTLAVLKAGWAVAQFFVGLSKGVENLTTAVTALTKRFDAHTRIVEDDLGDVRERVAALESWRETEGAR
jgi:hypothetical protein